MPDLPLDILDRIRQLEDQVRLVMGRAQMRPAMNQVLTGNVTVGQGGRFYVTAPNGNSIFYIGDIDPPHSDGSRQTGMILSREDGNIAMTLWAPDGGQQNPIIWDRTGHAIFSEDRTTGQGLARPFIGGGTWFGTTEVPQFTTTSTSFTTLMRSPWIKQQPRVAAWFLVRCSDGTTSGEIQLTDDNGTPISSVVSVGAGAFFYGGTSGLVAGDHESQGYLNWRARVLPGSTGNIGVRGLAVYGMPA
ncbi:hypothetical protein [Streptomyces sp. LS1784]|uniref:hypothetical protein n=1 Tax=Streptomyces sp. LS1784 TaxID=2851533 RepID=UPI001CCA35C3|nr:hypothetical protein [Streptomyces sp. LS1784]